MATWSHVCPYPGCESKFQRPSKLQVHIRKHTGERPFICDEPNCSKSYTNDSHLRRHKQRSHQNIKNEQCKCTEEGCNKEFLNADNLKRHKHQVHTKPYNCAVCDEAFHKKNKLRLHMVEHTGTLTFNCEFCSATFNHPYLLRKHNLNHKIYTCSCGKTFHRWTIYLKHRREEHKQIYQCEVCDKVLKTKLLLRYHLRTHDDNRIIYECPESGCRRLYFYEKNLQQHIKTFHMKIKLPLPPSKLKRKKGNLERKPVPTLETGRKRRKDINVLKESTALKLVGLTVSREAEKSLLEGKQIEGEISDSVVETSDYSDLDISITRIRKKELSTSDSDSTMKPIMV